MNKNGVQGDGETKDAAIESAKARLAAGEPADRRYYRGKSA